MSHQGHLGPDLSALVDGELGQDRRDRALAHVAGCDDCRSLLDQERVVKAVLGAATPPAPSERLVAALTALSQPGAPAPPQSRSTPGGPLVPRLPPPPRRGPRGSRRDSRAPGAGHPGRTARRARVATVGALSAVVVVLGAAFAAGAPARDDTRVVSPTAELSVEHTATDAGVPLGGGTGLATTFEDVFFPAAAPR